MKGFNREQKEIRGDKKYQNEIKKYQNEIKKRDIWVSEIRSKGIKWI